MDRQHFRAELWFRKENTSPDVFWVDPEPLTVWMILVRFKVQSHTLPELSPGSALGVELRLQVIAACVTPAAAHYAKTSVGRCPNTS